MSDSRTNFGKFQAELEKQYTELFKTDEYAYTRTRHTPGSLAIIMSLSLKACTANKDGEGIKRTCKALGIPYTYKAIKAYLEG